MLIEKNSWITEKNIAHRGLWGGDIIENSLSAYKNAVEKGFPIEIDLFMSTDGEIFSFHDDSLSRMTGVDGNIYEKTSDEIKSCRLLNSSEKIPSLNEVLDAVDGKVPLLIEIKNQPQGKKLIDKVIEVLSGYKGEYALQSFNPLYILRIKKKAPKILRGILATSEKEDLSGQNFINRFIIKNMALNFLIKPHFISYNYKGLPLKKRKRKNKAVIAWTITNEEVAQKIKDYSDNIIFENFIPKKAN